MKPIRLSAREARHFLLHRHGLLPPARIRGKAGILRHVRKVGCIQFDPLDVVGRNQDLVLQSRVAGYRPQMLESLLYEDRALIDGWDKNMAIWPVEDWPYFARYRAEQRQNLRGDPEGRMHAILPAVREAIARQGPLSSLHLDFDEKVDWWWAPTKLSRAALESMYLWGELVVHHKEHGRKLYAFAQDHLPAALLEAPDPVASEEAWIEWNVLRRVGSIGLLWNRGSDAWLGISGMKAGPRTAAFEKLTACGSLLPVLVEGIEPLLYMLQSDLPDLAAVQGGKRRPGAEASFLAPLDNLLWDRNLIRDLFGFEYRWEVYKPQAERAFGWYVLPVLYGDRFVARLEPGRDKKRRRLIVKNWWWAPDVRVTSAMRQAVTEALARFAEYLDCVDIQLEGNASEEVWMLEGGAHD